MFAALTTAATLAGCPEPPAPIGPNCKAFPQVGEMQTRSWFGTRDEFFAFALEDTVPAQLKFTLTDFSALRPGAAYFLDPRFYSLHDEWYWMRLLNGHPITGWDVAPVAGSPFDSVAAVYDYIRDGNPFPLDLRWVGEATERIYSERFYQAALEYGEWDGQDRFFGTGSVLWYPANPDRVSHPEELWAFELAYYYEKLGPLKLASFFAQLESCLPEDVAPRLKWVSRGTPHQDQLVEQVRASGGPLADRVLTYRDLAVDGEFGVYNAGISAGILKRYDGALGGASVNSETLVVANVVPDYLPPVAGIVTAVPQTPLAHLNLLAKARGTPNAYLGGVFDDPQLRTWEGIGRPVMVRADATSGVAFQALEYAEYDLYKQKLGLGALKVPQIDIPSAPLTVSLTELGIDTMAAFVPTIGGKCAGFMAFNDVAAMETPHAPMCISIRPYNEHLTSFVPLIEQLLLDEDFSADPRVRFVALEGEQDFRIEHVQDPEALSWLDAWLAGLDETRQLKAVIAAGGLKRIFRDKPLSWSLKETIEGALQARFGDLARSQGLRFRSSSTAEDIPGFNGAGLYNSNTGFLYAWERSGGDRDKTVEWALKKTWASYWSYEAFEERELAGIEHLTGNMAVLVHPRFDDPMELANGVITFTYKDAEGAPDTMEMVLNVQQGAVSVTNPDPENPALPEIDRVVGLSAAGGAVERVQMSSLVEQGELLLSDDELQFIYQQVAQLAQLWLATANGAWDEAQQSSTLVLDLEFKKMAAGWPAWSDPARQVPDDRIVFKQVRVLDNPIWVSEASATKPIPRDLLSVAAKLTRKSCTGDAVDFETLEVTTDPAKSQLLTYTADAPFTAEVDISIKQSVPGMSIALEGFVPDHTQLAAVQHLGDAANWRTRYTMPGWLKQLYGGLETFEMASDGSYIIGDGVTTYAGTGLKCTVEALETGASEYLEELWQKKLEQAAQR